MNHKSLGIMSRAFLFTILCLLPILSFTQRDWTVPYGPEQVFLKNDGQFDHVLSRENILYGLDHGFGWQVMFNENSAFLISRKGSRPHEAYEMSEEMETEETVVRQEWIGLSPNAILKAQDLRSDYFTYSYETADGYVNADHVNAYETLKYESAYPGIDIYYDAPAEGGIKYSIHLAAGADPTQIRLKYTGNGLHLDPSGNLHINTVLGDLVDHAPTAKYADGNQENITCSFQLIGSEIRFILGQYVPTRPVIIDPWTVNPALPAPFNRAFEVDADGAGNVYVFGGGMGYNVKKYNPAGTLQWTHVSPWDTSNAWFGELLVLPAGDVFITSGSAAKIRRLTTAGATVFTNNGPFLNFDEYWTLSLNCDNTRLLSGGSRIISLTSPQGHLFNLNMANGNQVAGSPYNVAPTGMNEVRGLNRSADGFIYMLSNNNLIKMNNTFVQVFNIANGYSMPYYSPAYMAQSVQGVNAVDANATGLYISNGLALERRNPATGAVVTTVNIPSGGFSSGFFGTGATNSGLALDNCGSLYVGSTNQVLKYNASLVQQATVATSGAVYDVVVAAGGAVIWGGNGFVTSNTSLAPCAPQTYTCPPLDVELASYGVSCENDRPTISASFSHLSPGYTIHLERSPNGNFWQFDKELNLQNGDHVATALTESGWFYRLAFTDPQGKVEHTMVVAAPDCGVERPWMEVFPTVVTDGVYFQTLEEVSGPISVELFSSMGTFIKAASYEDGALGTSYRLEMEGLSAGTYLVTVRNGNRVITKALLKQ